MVITFGKFCISMHISLVRPPKQSRCHFTDKFFKSVLKYGNFIFWFQLNRNLFPRFQATLRSIDWYNGIY